MVIDMYHAFDTACAENIIKNEIKASVDEVNSRIDELLKSDDKDISRLIESMRYSTLSSGKRIRPFLTRIVCKSLGAEPQKALDYACALELIHTYSLIHDDLPAMDNDDYRRGMPTNHRIFGEATAILAGDALLTYAFEIAASNKMLSQSENLKAVLILSTAAGTKGMIGGQQIDMSSQGKMLSLDELIRMHELKTGALIKAAVSLGVLAAGKADDKETADAYYKYASCIGLCFQIIDDILDVTASPIETGKSASDIENKKNTFTSAMPVEEAYDYAVKKTIEAIMAVNRTDSDGMLAAFATYLLMRQK